MTTTILQSNAFCFFQDYEVLNLLGKGGFASVYRAKCIRSGIEVAIKMVIYLCVLFLIEHCFYNVTLVASKQLCICVTVDYAKGHVIFETSPFSMGFSIYLKFYVSLIFLRLWILDK